MISIPVGQLVGSVGHADGPLELGSHADVACFQNESVSPLIAAATRKHEARAETGA